MLPKPPQKHRICVIINQSTPKTDHKNENQFLNSDDNEVDGDQDSYEQPYQSVYQWQFKQVKTPSWGIEKNKHKGKVTFYPQKRIKIQKIKELNQDYQRNQKMYKNMKNQYYQICKSHLNIENSIYNIRYPFGSQKNKKNDPIQQKTQKNSQQQAPFNEQQFDNSNRSNINYFRKRTNGVYLSGYNYVKPQMNQKKQTQQLNQQLQQQLKQQPIIHTAKKKQTYVVQSHNYSLNDTNNHINNQPYENQQQQYTITKYQISQESQVQDNNCKQEQKKNVQVQTQQRFINKQQTELTEQIEPKIDQNQPVNTNLTNDPIQQNNSLQIQQKQDELNIKSQPLPISLIFIPFNKLNSSTILQLTNKKQLILAKKYTIRRSNNTINRIDNGIKYKNINLVVNQNQLYKIVEKHTIQVQNVLKNNLEQIKKYYLYRNYQQEMDIFQRCVSIGIVGGQNTMKQKVHFTMIKDFYKDIIRQIQVQLQNSYNIFVNSSNTNNQQPITKDQFPSLIIGISHQQQQQIDDPYIIKYEGKVGLNRKQNEIVYGNIQAVIDKIFVLMKIVQNQREGDGQYKHVRVNQFGHIYNNIQVSNKHHQTKIHFIRVTNIYIKSMLNTSQLENKNNYSFSQQTLYHIKIISTNKIDHQFIKNLQLDSVIWCINPLYKYYENTKQCLDCCNQYKCYPQKFNQESKNNLY